MTLKYHRSSQNSPKQFNIQTRATLGSVCELHNVPLLVSIFVDMSVRRVAHHSIDSIAMIITGNFPRQ